MNVLATLLLTAFFAVPSRTSAPYTLEQSARALLSNFVAGRFEAASIDFNDELRPVVTPTLLAQVTEELDKKAGKFQAVTTVRHLNQDGFRVIELIARFEKASVSVRVVFDMANRVRAVYFNPILPPPVEPALEAMARELLADIVAGRFEVAGKHFDDTMRGQLPPANLAELNKKILTAFGTFQSVKEVRERVEEPYRVIDVIASCDRLPLAFRVSFDSKGRIAALHISPKIQP